MINLDEVLYGKIVCDMPVEEVPAGRVPLQISVSTLRDMGNRVDLVVGDQCRVGNVVYEWDGSCWTCATSYVEVVSSQHISGLKCFL